MTHLNLLLLSSKLLHVKLQLLSFQQVTISSSSLAGSGRDSGVKSTLQQVLGQHRVQLSHSCSFLPSSLDFLTHLGLLNSAILVDHQVRGSRGKVDLSSSLLDHIHAVVLLKPKFERGSIHLHDTSLHESLGSDQLVRGSVVHHIQDTGLSGDVFTTPGVRASFESQSSLLDVATSASNKSDFLGAKLG
jgi:hypothetical protein